MPQFFQVFRSCILLCFVAIAFSANAQDNFTPGYVETLDGQVIRGHVEKQDNLTSGFIFNFRPTGGEPVSYNAEQVRGYGLDGDRSFISYRVLINADSAYVFLEEIEKGKITAYRFLNRYFVKHNGVINELFNPVVNNTELKSYLGVLRTIFSDCPRTVRLVEQYATSDENWGDVIRKTVMQYNNCKPDERSTISLLVSGGLHLMATEFSGTTDPAVQFYSSRKFYSDQKLNIGLDIDIYLRRFSNVISFQAGARYLPVKTTTSVLTDKEFNELTFSSKRLLIPVGLRFTLTRRPESSFYLSAKVVPSVLFAQSSYRIREENLNGSIYSTSSTFRESVGLGFLGGVGYQRKVGKLGIFGEANYMLLPGTAALTDLPGGPVKTTLGGINLTVGIKVK